MIDSHWTRLGIIDESSVVACVKVVIMDGMGWVEDLGRVTRSD